MSDTSDPSGRRRFLRTSLGATVLLAGTRVSASALGANDRIRIGVIGTGGRARGLMRNLKDLPGQQIVAVSDVYEPRMMEAAETTRVPASSAVAPRDVRRKRRRPDGSDVSLMGFLLGARPYHRPRRPRPSSRPDSGPSAGRCGPGPRRPRSA